MWLTVIACLLLSDSQVISGEVTRHKNKRFRNQSIPQAEPQVSFHQDESFCLSYTLRYLNEFVNMHVTCNVYLQSS